MNTFAAAAKYAHVHLLVCVCACVCILAMLCRKHLWSLSIWWHQSTRRAHRRTPKQESKMQSAASSHDDRVKSMWSAKISAAVNNGWWASSEHQQIRSFWRIQHVPHLCCSSSSTDLRRLLFDRWAKGKNDIKLPAIMRITTKTLAYLISTWSRSAALI